MWDKNCEIRVFRLLKSVNSVNWWWVRLNSDIDCLENLALIWVFCHGLKRLIGNLDSDDPLFYRIHISSMRNAPERQKLEQHTQFSILLWQNNNFIVMFIEVHMFWIPWRFNFHLCYPMAHLLLQVHHLYFIFLVNFIFIGIDNFHILPLWLAIWGFIPELQHKERNLTWDQVYSLILLIVIAHGLLHNLRCIRISDSGNFSLVLDFDPIWLGLVIDLIGHSFGSSFLDPLESHSLSLFVIQGCDPALSLVDLYAWDIWLERCGVWLVIHLAQ